MSPSSSARSASMAACASLGHRLVVFDQFGGALGRPASAVGGVCGSRRHRVLVGGQPCEGVRVGAAQLRAHNVDDGAAAIVEHAVEQLLFSSGGAVQAASDACAGISSGCPES